MLHHWLEQEIAKWVHTRRIDPMTHRTMNERSTSELRPAPHPDSGIKWVFYYWGVGPTQTVASSECFTTGV